MTSRPPPKVATWLLQKFLYGRHVESVLGDLMQLYRQGRSRAWYWNQVLRAILAGTVEGMRANGRSLMTALIVGWAVILLWRELNAVFIHGSGDIYWSLRAHMHAAEATPDVRSKALFMVWGLGALLRSVSFGVSGWLAARLNARCPRLAVIVLAASVAMWPVAWHQLRVLEGSMQWLAHYGTALLGIFVGGWIASMTITQRSRMRAE